MGYLKNETDSDLVLPLVDPPLTLRPGETATVPEPQQVEAPTGDEPEIDPSEAPPTVTGTDVSEPVTAETTAPEHRTRRTTHRASRED